MKPFHVNSIDTVHRLTLPIQFMKFGVEDQEIVVPIRRREKETSIKMSRGTKICSPPSTSSADPTSPGRSLSQNATGS